MPSSKAKKGPPSSKTNNAQQQPPVSSPPNWPPLRPTLPAADLELVPLVPLQILIISSFFTSSLCRGLIGFFSTLTLTTTPNRPKRGEAVRVNDRFQIQDPLFAENLWSGTALKDLVQQYSEKDDCWGGEVLGLNPNIRIYRYRSGQFFDKHYDDSNDLMFGSPPVRARTTWTLLIYLTACHGGETVFYPEGSKKDSNPDPVEVGPEIGMALLHRHGEKCMLHEGKEVTDGEKWVLRSDLVVRR
ncbi:MAG: hypothetical protein Q9227_005717 [Pyrenula ochraceoflavens]